MRLCFEWVRSVCRPSEEAPPLIVHPESSSLLGPVDPSFRALFERLKLTVQRHKSNKDMLSFIMHILSQARSGGGRIPRDQPCG